VGDITGARVAEWAEIWGIPVILLNGAGPVTGEWVIRLRPDMEALFHEIGSLCAGMKKDKVFAICPADPDFQQMCQAFQKGAQAAGQQNIIPVECQDPDTCAKTLAGLVPKGKQAYPVFSPFPLKQTIRLLAFLDFMEKRGRFVVVGGPLLNVASLLLRRAAELDGLLFGDVFAASTMPALDTQYHRVTGHGLSTLEVWAMDSAGLACQAYLQGASTRDAIRDSFKQTENFQGIAGTYINTGTGWQNFVRLFMVRDGVIRPFAQ
jgi:hypothetical protein